MTFQCVVLVVLVGLGMSTATDDLTSFSESYDIFPSGPRPLRDRFRIIQTNLTADALKTEIDDFTSYGCESMVVITNDAQNWLRLWCASYQDKAKEVHLVPGQSFIFTFRPQTNGRSFFFCTLDYMRAWARFDVYNKGASYMCPREVDNIYRYSVRHDGIYANKNRKIRSLFKGHNGYSLWEQYNNKTNETDDLIMTGFVDGGECADLGHEHNDRASAVTVCDHQCVILYEHHRCEGHSRKVQSSDGCIDVELETLNKKLSAVKGC